MEAQDSNVEPNNQFEHIKLEEEESDGSIADVDEDVPEATVVKKKKMTKKKKIYFRSDFTGELESSSDEDDLSDRDKKQGICALNPHELGWGMWVWYYVVVASTSTFHAAEYCGEKLADFFGITSPKYQYVIDEYHRLKQVEEEEEEAERQAEEYLRQQQLQRMQQMEGGQEEDEHQS